MQLNEKTSDIEKWFLSDDRFDQLYATPIQALARKHWTQLEVAKKAAEFLSAERNAKILDIGSGVGKFCLAAAHYQPNAFYYGVEQRSNLIEQAEQAREALQLDNVSFIHGNFTQLDFRKYDHFYFYNSFFENIADSGQIDDSIAYSGELFNYYNRYLYRQLEKKPIGTRLVTFHSMDDEIPQGFHMVDSDINNLLKCWIKVEMRSAIQKWPLQEVQKFQS